jgi:RNA polymerase sigma-B factor
MPKTALAERPGAVRTGSERARRQRDDQRLMRRHKGGDASARDELIERYMPLARSLALRYRRASEPLDDLVQVASVGLVKAVDRWDPDRGLAFSSYAVPTILGEIKRHFRAKGWAIRVPRRLQELRMSIGKASADLSQELGRSPTAAELATRLGVEVEEVLEGLESANAYATLSLDAGDDAEDSPGSMLDTLGEDDEGLAHVEIRESIKPLIETLPARERRILLLRFFRGMTQSQIAAEIGVSQMHVSRLLSRTLDHLRTEMREVG